MQQRASCPSAPSSSVNAPLSGCQRRSCAVLLAVLLAGAACGGTDATPADGGQPGSGGATSAPDGGNDDTRVPNDASTGSGGRPGTGGQGTATGGSTGTGGKTGSGGSLGSGGGAATGGRAATGGAGGTIVSGTGGVTGSGGAGATSCDTPPAPSGLVGWAAVAGKNTTTTTGGGSAAPVVVTSTAAFNTNAAGTVARVLHVRGTLKGVFTIGSNKTIVGLCGATLQGQISINNASNVIVRNINLVGYATGNCALDPDFDASVGCSSGNDAVSVVGSHHVWFDHCDVSDGTDGNLDITSGSDFVTVSWTKFHYSPRTDSTGSDSTGASGHRFSNLVGGSDDSAVDMNALNVTWHHNWWAENVSERQPRVRYGKNHLFNNLWSGKGNYCVRAGVRAQLLLEKNIFFGVSKPHEFNSSDDQSTAFITADPSNNVYTNTTGAKATGGGGTPFTTPSYAYAADDVATLQAAVQSGAGPR